MKIILLALLVLLSKCTLAQTDSLSNSIIEKFSNKSGNLYKREFIDLKTFSGVKVQVLRITDLLNKPIKTVTGIKFTYDGQYISYNAFIDADEISNLMASMEFMINHVYTDSTIENYTEVNYKTRDGFQVGYYFSRKQWIPYIQLESYTIKSLVTLDQSQFTQLYGIFKISHDKYME